MWMLLLVAYGQRNPNAYFLTQHIRQSFSKGISDTMSIQDVISWANTTLLTNLFGEHPGQRSLMILTLHCFADFTHLTVYAKSKMRIFSAFIILTVEFVNE